MTRKKATRPAEDLGGRVRDVIALGVAHLEKRMKTLTTGKSDSKKQGEVLELVKEAATIMGHIRRYDEAMRAASRDLSPAIVIAYLRALPADKRLGILAELGDEDDDQEEGSVLS